MELKHIQLVEMTQAELGAVSDLITLIETASLQKTVKSGIAKLTQYVKSIHAMRGKGNLAGYKLVKYNKAFFVPSFDIIYTFYLEKEDDSI